jgi:hypothetical protein
VKHIKRKFLFEIRDAKIMDQLKDSGKGEFFKPEELSRVKFPKDKFVLMFDELKNGYSCFPYVVNGKNYFVPEPDPILIYFNNAQFNFRNIQKSRDDLLHVLDVENKSLTSDMKDKLYEFLFYSSGYTIFLFTSIEAMINKTIPADYIYRKENKRNTELYNYQQIQRYLSFEEKLGMIEKAAEKSFKKSFPLKQQHIDNLKNFRDTIIHTKKDADIHAPYTYMFKAALNFEYQKNDFGSKGFNQFLFGRFC